MSWASVNFKAHLVWWHNHTIGLYLLILEPTIYFGTPAVHPIVQANILIKYHPAAISQHPVARFRWQAFGPAFGLLSRHSVRYRGIRFVFLAFGLPFGSFLKHSFRFLDTRFVFLAFGLAFGPCSSHSIWHSVRFPSIRYVFLAFFVFPSIRFVFLAFCPFSRNRFFFRASDLFCRHSVWHLVCFRSIRSGSVFSAFGGFS